MMKIKSQEAEHRINLNSIHGQKNVYSLKAQQMNAGASYNEYDGILFSNKKIS